MVQEQYYLNTQLKGSKFTRNEWNIWLVRALLAYSKAIWKNRCNFYHEQSNMNMEKQTRILAIELKTTLKSPAKYKRMVGESNHKHAHC